MKQFEADGIVDVIKNNMIGFGSDGARVNLGKDNGLAKILSNWAERDLYKIHCMPHRLELAVKKTLKKDEYFPDAIALVNKIYNFYYTRQT